MVNVFWCDGCNQCMIRDLEEFRCPFCNGPTDPIGFIEEGD